MQSAKCRILCLHPARRIIEFSGWEWTQHFRPWQIATGMTLLAVASMVMFIIASEVLGARNLALYWPLKIGYIVCGMTIGFGLTALWEERVVAGLALRSRPACGYFISVIRANYLAFGIALLVGAIRMLPRRLNSEDFLVWLLEVLGRG